MTTLKLTHGPVRVGSSREIAYYECTRCRAKLEVVIDEWCPDAWHRTPS